MIQDLSLFLIGIIVGIMNAIAGGGIILGFPALMAAGLPALAANATSNIVVLPGQLSSIFGYRKYLRKVPNRYLLLIIPCFFGGIIGALILRYTSPHSFEKLVPGLILMAIVLFAFQPLLHFHLHNHIKKSKAAKTVQPLILLGIAILPMAIYGGYFGAGFGFMMLAFLGLTSMHDVHQMNALKNLAGLVIASVSIICLSSSGLINWRLGLVMAAGNLIGGYVGARIAQRVSSHSIRIVVIIIGITTTAFLAVRSYSKTM